jgi:hypothetical protein
MTAASGGVSFGWLRHSHLYASGSLLEVGPQPRRLQLAASFITTRGRVHGAFTPFRYHGNPPR